MLSSRKQVWKSDLYHSHWYCQGVNSINDEENSNDEDENKDAYIRDSEPPTFQPVNELTKHMKPTRLSLNELSNELSIGNWLGQTCNSNSTSHTTNFLELKLEK